MQIVGRMIYDKDTNTISVAHLTFWGNRVERQFSASDIVAPTFEPSSILRRRFHRVYLYSEPKPFFLFPTSAKIADPTLLVEILANQSAAPKS
jgi:hypothetical protein